MQGILIINRKTKYEVVLSDQGLKADIKHMPLKQLLTIFPAKDFCLRYL